MREPCGNQAAAGLCRRPMTRTTQVAGTAGEMTKLQQAASKYLWRANLIPGDRRTRYARRDRTRPVTGAQRRELELADPITQSRPHACSALGPGWWLAGPQAPARAPCGCSVSAARKWNADRAMQCNRARQRRPPSGLAMNLWALARGPRTADGGTQDAVTGSG